MNGASKILTVSYGTFSCTLEGFDDPFNTMKAIAEYFRDLAAEDRYFGAEPPTPDAAMLHRIAEREVQRRVEAKVGEHGITLRAGEAAETPAPAPMPAPLPAVQPEPVAAPAKAEPMVEPVLGEPAPSMESAAARLLRLRAAQAQMQMPAAPQPVARPLPDTQAYAEDQEAEPAPTPARAPASSAPVEDEAEADLPLDRVMAALRAEPAAPAAAEPEADVAPAPEDAPGLTSLRETLSGLAPQDEQLAEDMALSQSANASALAEDEPEAMAAEAAAEVDVALDVAADLDAPVADDAAVTAEEPAIAASAEVALADAAPADGPEVTVPDNAPFVAEKLQRARARVIKIRRLDRSEPAPAVLSPEDEADLQNTLAALSAEATPVAEAARPAETPDVEEALVLEAPAARAPTENPLSGAADASVERILAQTNQQLDVPETKRRRSAIAHLKAAVLATVADRRNTPKAKAEVEEAKADPYRDDLGKVVRPLPAVGASERPAPLVLVSAQRIDRKPDAAGSNRPVPQIVSSTPAPVASPIAVRPRRVTATGSLAQAQDLADDEDGDEDFDAVARFVTDGGKQSFAEFAENLGAESLSDLLEAAGAYCTLVLDRPSFSRPLLFQQVTQLPAMADAKREDSLRNFGKLLREGRFQKTVRGQFALSETSPILSEAKRLAG